MNDEYLMTGSFGLDIDAWQTCFYDDDLPPDWRAAYYSTLLRSVYLPPQEWRKAVEDDWFDEVDDEFRFVLQAQSVDELNEIASLSKEFSDLVTGIVLESKKIDDIKALINEIEKSQKMFPLCLDAGPLDYEKSGIAKICDGAGVSCVWYPSTQPEPLSSGDFLVTLISEEKLPEQREIVTAIEQWMAGTRRAGLFNTSEKDAPLRAQETRILTELMGV